MIISYLSCNLHSVAKKGFFMLQILLKRRYSFMSELERVGTWHHFRLFVSNEYASDGDFQMNHQIFHIYSLIKESK